MFWQKNLRFNGGGERGMSILCKAAAVKTKKEFREVSYLLNSTLHGLSVQSQKSILAHIKVHKVKTYVGEQMKSFFVVVVV